MSWGPSLPGLHWDSCVDGVVSLEGCMTFVHVHVSGAQSSLCMNRDTSQIACEDTEGREREREEKHEEGIQASTQKARVLTFQRALSHRVVSKCCWHSCPPGTTRDEMRGKQAAWPLKSRMNHWYTHTHHTQGRGTSLGTIMGCYQNKSRVSMDNSGI